MRMGPVIPQNAYSGTRTVQTHPSAGVSRRPRPGTVPCGRCGVTDEGVQRRGAGDRPILRVAAPETRPARELSAAWQRALYLPLIILAWLAVLLVGGWLATHLTKTILLVVLSAIIAFAL